MCGEHFLWAFGAERQCFCIQVAGFVKSLRTDIVTVIILSHMFHIVPTEHAMLSNQGQLSNWKWHFNNVKCKNLKVYEAAPNIGCLVNTELVYVRQLLRLPAHLVQPISVKPQPLWHEVQEQTQKMPHGCTFARLSQSFSYIPDYNTLVTITDRYTAAKCQWLPGYRKVDFKYCKQMF